MTVVDVNTGKFVGSGGNLEETVTKNNLEAAEEIVRQLRLRDIGGIIVIDFIDMVLESNRDLVVRRLLECLGRDRTKHQVAEVTSLGLVQMTRKRVGSGPGRGLLRAVRALRRARHPRALRAGRPRRLERLRRRPGRLPLGSGPARPGLAGRVRLVRGVLGLRAATAGPVADEHRDAVGPDRGPDRRRGPRRRRCARPSTGEHGTTASMPRGRARRCAERSRGRARAESPSRSPTSSSRPSRRPPRRRRRAQRRAGPRGTSVRAGAPTRRAGCRRDPPSSRSPSAASRWPPQARAGRRARRTAARGGGRAPRGPATRRDRRGLRSLPVAPVIWRATGAPGSLGSRCAHRADVPCRPRGCYRPVIQEACE